MYLSFGAQGKDANFTRKALWEIIVAFLCLVDLQVDRLRIGMHSLEIDFLLGLSGAGLARDIEVVVVADDSCIGTRRALRLIGFSGRC